MAIYDQIPGKIILEKHDSCFGVISSMQRLGDKHKISEIGAGIQYGIVGFFGKKHSSTLKQALYSITINFENSETSQADGISGKRLAFLQEAKNVFKSVGESKNGKKLVFDDDAPYKEMFELAYNKDKISF